MFSIGSRKMYGRLVLWSSLSLFSLMPASAEDRKASNAAQEYARCLQTGRIAGDGAATPGFLIRDGLEPTSFSVWSAADGGPIAQVLVDRSGEERFDKKSAGSQALMEEVAKLNGTPVAKRELSTGITIISVNSSAPAAAFVGMSLLIDSRRNEMVQWYWQASRRYEALGLATLQATVWQQLSSCFNQNGIAETENLDIDGAVTFQPQLRKHAAVAPDSGRE